jgi:hypothetical protein
MGKSMGKYGKTMGEPWEIIGKYMVFLLFNAN